MQTASRPSDQEYDLKDLFKVLRRRRAFIIGTAAVLTAAATLVAINLTPRYNAVSTIMVEPRDIQIVDFAKSPQNAPQDISMINTHVELLTSHSFIERVIEALDLLDNPEFNITLRDQATQNRGDRLVSADRFEPLQRFVSKALSWANVPPWAKVPLIAIGVADEGPSSTRERLAEKPPSAATDGRSVTFMPELQAKADQAIKANEGASGPDAKPTAILPEKIKPAAMLPEKEPGRSSALAENEREASVSAATEIFLKQLEVGPSGQSYAISIAFTSVDPQTAARVANAIAELYVKHQLESKQDAAAGALDWLAPRLNELREQLVQTEKAVEAYRAKNELVASDRQPGFSEQELAALNQELIRSRSERIVTEAKLRRLRQLRRSGQELDAVPEVMMSPVIANIRKEEIDLDRQEAQLRQEYGPHHPKFIQLQADKDKLSDRLDAEIGNITASLENGIAIIDARERTLQANLERAKAASVQNGRAEIQLRLLEREADSTRTLYTTFLDRFKELTEQRQMQKPGVRVISTAAVPTTPSFPRVRLVTGAGFMGSLIFATLLAFVVDRLDGGMRTSRQAEEVLNIPQIGFVPKLGGLMSARRAHHYLADKPTSAYAEAIRAVQTALHFSNIDRPPQVLLVTSSLPGEGKTTLALSLAAIFARSGLKTVAIDLDLRHPCLGVVLNQSDRGDLVDFMRGEKTLDGILHAVDGLDALHLIPARCLAVNPTDLLASERMASLMTELRARYQYVVLDSPPLLGMSDSRFAARLADAVVFVVRWGKTSEEIALKGLRLLQDGGAPVAGVVLTRVNVRRHRKYNPADVIHYYRRYKKYYAN